MKVTDRKLFGTDGIRGKANIYPMTPEIVLSVGKYLAHIIKNSSNNKHKIIVGKDTRLSGYMFENAIVSGICSSGADVLLVGVMPTAGISYLTRDMRAEAGIVITASHNFFDDNGIKIFDKYGFKLSDKDESAIEDCIFSERKCDFGEISVGREFRIEDARGRYISYLKKIFPPDLDLNGIKICLDVANGAAYKISPIIFEELGAEVLVINNKPDGTNINRGCGAVYPENISSFVVENKCDIGICFDGDSDRVIFIDEGGKTINGDAILAISAKQLIEKSGPQNIVSTVMSNLALDEFIRSIGGDVIRTDVGDRNVIEAMRNNGCVFGGENSGHLIYLNDSTTGDGILGSLKILEEMKRSGKKISELSQIIRLYPRSLINMDVKSKRPIEEMRVLKETIDRAKSVVGDTGKVLVRYSGTENVLRILVEYKDEKIANSWAKEIKIVAEAYLTYEKQIWFCHLKRLKRYPQHII